MKKQAVLRVFIPFKPGSYHGGIMFISFSKAYSTNDFLSLYTMKILEKLVIIMVSRYNCAGGSNYGY